jgi:predicted flap endonuclease-1-like 5' DNA nuclease
MFGTLDILFDALQSIAGKNRGSRYSTVSRCAERALPPPDEPPTERARPSAKHDEPLANHDQPSTKRNESSMKHDDLRRIEGIGPKISNILVEAGITTFSQLAASSVEDLREILAGAGLRGLANPSSWPEQARLASMGDWDSFQKLKDELQGGRRI